VKPDNFLISSADNRVKLIDFGLMINYMPDGVHRQQGKYPFQGTASFASLNTLLGSNASRRDDLEGLGYTIMYIIDEQSVPWREIQQR
jgi:serine/threonine protein kinase